MFVLITYDVSTISPEGRRRLRRVARVCENFGQRVQLSVFECQVGDTEMVKLRHQLLEEMNPGEDSIRFYFLGEDPSKRVELAAVHMPAVAVSRKNKFVVMQFGASPGGARAVRIQGRTAHKCFPDSQPGQESAGRRRQ